MVGWSVVMSTSQGHRDTTSSTCRGFDLSLCLNVFWSSPAYAAWQLGRIIIMQGASYCPVCISSVMSKLVNINKHDSQAASETLLQQESNESAEPLRNTAVSSKRTFRTSKYTDIMKACEGLRLMSHKLLESATSVFFCKSMREVNVSSHDAFGKRSPDGWIIN